ncbi:MAG: 16S rRNA (cytosine(967)-C(5))-methyltransferase RsmB [Oscillospiraceae bacterium]|nr:16S rRNA (cytosine(967)-C(5))-methyltransferase RsmB [Oscillospiraceae bacterium]
MPNARKKAIDCLLRCERGGFSNLVLLQELASSGLDARDRGFCTALVYGTLSRKLTADSILSSCLDRPLAKLDAEVLEILRAGVYQIFWMDSVPARAAISESVDLCRAFRKSSAAGLVNAVLRRCSALELESVINSASDENEKVSLRYSVCPELAEMFRRQYGTGAEEILASFFEPSDTYLRVNTLITDEDSAIAHLKDEGIETEKTELPGCLRIVSGFSGRSSMITSGEVRIQSLPAQFAAHAVNAVPGDTLLDMCSAPGGKTMCLAQDMHNEGRLIALDSSPRRLELVRKAASRERINIVETICSDASEYHSDMQFDAVLCDVPCSGYGEMASKPELRYKSPAVSEPLPEIQYSILCNAARMVRDGGRIVYSTCTVLERENRDVIDRFLAEHRQFRLALPEMVPSFASVDRDMISFVPGKGGSEGFFVAAMVKI